MRIAVGQLFQESNTFVPFKTTVANFESVYIRRGAEILSGFGEARVEVPGFLSVLSRARAEVVPLVAASALSGGVLARESFERLMTELLESLGNAGRLDGLLLSLHGAMCIEDEPDAEGEILERVLKVLPPGTPVGVSLDLHAHVTPRMLQPGVFLIGYREYPHIDMFETGARVAELMCNTVTGRSSPVMALAKRPMLVSPVTARTTNEPLRTIVAAARALEGVGPVLHTSVFPVQPWLDVPDLGFGVLVCANGDRAAAQRAAETVASQAWNARDRFAPDLVDLGDAIATGLRSEGTTVVADCGDAPTSGAAADNTAVLRALLAAGADRSDRLSYLTLCDEEAAMAAASAGVGRVVDLTVGHKRSREDGAPLAISAKVRSIHDGSLIMYDKGAQGTRLDQGLTVVLAIGSIRLVVRSIPAMEWDRGIFSAFGLELERAALVFVKSPSHFRTSFEPRANRILIADTPGPTCPNMRRLSFKRATRPLYPLDDFTSVTP